MKTAHARNAVAPADQSEEARAASPDILELSVNDVAGLIGLAEDTRECEDVADPVLAYYRSRNQTYRDLALVKYFPLVEYVAERLAYKLGNDQVTADDLTGYGIDGLYDALDKFVPDKGFLFKTYAQHRILGSMLDEIRRVDWVPRLVRIRESELQNAQEVLTVRLCRPPTLDELAAELNMDPSEIHIIVNDSRKGRVLSLDYVGESEEGDPSVFVDTVPDPKAESAFTSLSREEFWEYLSTLVDKMHKNHDYIGPSNGELLLLLCREGKTMREIAEMHGLTESRICQRANAIALHLHQRMLENRGRNTLLGGIAERFLGDISRQVEALKAKAEAEKAAAPPRAQGAAPAPAASPAPFAITDDAGVEE